MKWRLLWAGTLVYTRSYWRVRIEWGPPIIFWPRFSRTVLDVGTVWMVGLGWWIFTLAHRPNGFVRVEESRP